jgi:hypothetical protein
VAKVRKVLVGLGGIAGAWLAFLALFGWLGADCQRRSAEARLAGKMRASVTIGRLELGLVTGAIGVERLHVLRDDRGLFRLDIARVDLDLLPLGLMLVQGGIGDVRVRGATLEVSALGALDMRGGKGKPLRFDSLDLRDSSIAIEATSVLPGLTRVTVHVDRSSAGATTLRTPMSWLFALRELDATLELPGGLTARLQYANGAIHISGKLVGDKPIDLPFEIPRLDPARELEQLRGMGIALGKALLEEAAKRYLRRDSAIVPAPAEARP